MPHAKQVQKDIAVAYSRLIKDPQVSVRVMERNSRQPASISGAVRQCGKIPMERKIRLNEVIAAAGGFTEKAAGTIQILPHGVGAVSWTRRAARGASD